MPQLSILIPFTGNEKELESTLVSVLENRPYQCEIIVAHPGNYADPYDLGDEVSFVQLPEEGLGLGQIIQLTLEHTESPIIHLLACGTQVTPGWTRDVLDAFEDPYVGSVCPIVLNEDDTVFCVGVENTLLYRNRMLGSNRRMDIRDCDRYEPVGPSQYAGFYRVDGLREITCLNELSDSLFGLEAGLSLEAIGYETKVVDSSLIRRQSEMESSGDADDSQAAIWRFAGSLGFAQGLTLSLVGLVTDLVTSPFSSTSRRSLISRLRKFVDTKTANEFREFVENARGPVTSGQTLPIQSYKLELSGTESESTRRAA